MGSGHGAPPGRREFLLTLAGVTGLSGARPATAAAEPPPETTRLRLVQIPGICVAPQYVAEALLRAEGFTDVRYVREVAAFGTAQPMAAGQADISMAFAAPLIIRVEAGAPVVILGGGHVGCFELFATDRVRGVHDLKGKTVAVPDLESIQYVFIAIMAAHVGLNPRKDIRFVTHPPAEAIRLLAERKVDAFLGFLPDPLELRAKKIGHVVVNSAVDRPWSQYFCCMTAGNREFVRKHPVATKRALRAILKAADLCALEPARAARFLVDNGYERNYEYALQTMREIPYGRWREYAPEDTVRFWALRLHEAGMIKSSPQKILTQGTNWRFLNELKRELKG